MRRVAGSGGNGGNLDHRWPISRSRRRMRPSTSAEGREDPRAEADEPLGLVHADPSARQEALDTPPKVELVSDSVLVPPGGGEIVGDSPERRVEILSDHETLNATWSRFGPHREGADLHVHRQHTDLFYVLAGELTRQARDRGRARRRAGRDARARAAARRPRLPERQRRRAPLPQLPRAGPAVCRLPPRDARRPRRSSTTSTLRPSDGGRPTAEVVVGGEEVVADRQGLRVALLADVEEIGIAETRSDPGGAAAPAHVHHRHAESFYVLEGELALHGRRARAPGRGGVVGAGAAGRAARVLDPGERSGPLPRRPHAELRLRRVPPRTARGAHGRRARRGAGGVRSGPRLEARCDDEDDERARAVDALDAAELDVGGRRRARDERQSGGGRAAR